MPATGRKGGGKFASVKTGKREDLPFRPRSSWEANVARLFEYKGLRFQQDWWYETYTFFFPRDGTKNSKIILDFPLRPHVLPVFYRRGPWVYAAGSPILPTWLEVKGMLARGGRLDRIDLSSLRGRDDDSRVKLERLKFYYPWVARRTWLLGEREYHWLEKRYGLLVPHWEGLAVPKRKRATAT